MNKKGLSILLALSMVFSLNSMAFAEEALVEEEAVVETAAEDDVEVTQSNQSKETYEERVFAIAYDPTLVSCNNVSLGSTDLKLRAEGGITYEETYEVQVPDEKNNEDEQDLLPGSVKTAKTETETETYTAYGVLPYTGKKLTAERLGLTLRDTKTLYGIPVKKIKLTGSNKKATATGKVTFKVTSIGGVNDLIPNDTDAEGANIVTAKAAYKELKAKFKAGKNQEFSAYIIDSYIDDSVSDAYIKDLKSKKKSLSSGDVTLISEGDKILITTKNGQVKKVEIPYIEYKYKKSKLNDTGYGKGDVYTAKLKFRKLKKGKDYTVSGEFAVFDSSSSYTAGGAIKAK